MKLPKSAVLTVTVLCAFVIAIAISTRQPVEEVLQQSNQAVEQAFNQEAKTPNQDLNQLSLFLPNTFEVFEQESNNVILESNGQTYILFHNSLENESSQLNYEAVNEKNDHLLLESFENQGRFGYIYISEADTKSEFQLQIGVGGIKITTITEKSDAATDAKDMMLIANSLIYNDHEE
ncbi:hypothetical protein J416_14208 [Gracilibacillus halophilus YIM-C55.5]|uniref:Uncharacterized protein n=1 Tax=Gracilibacillus halophilus YIM-C55.5 TaxID=1308866 RepID=N4WMP9_9BACI|nr:hypothetical protein [Gracilibacillus halophilus]ENH95795.1 hypothetical protein J416_14208 [Gracilibacillus halophilus YIM-C55.5]